MKPLRVLEIIVYYLIMFVKIAVLIQIMVWLFFPKEFGLWLTQLILGMKN